MVTEDEVRAVLRELASRGGKARAVSLTAKRRAEIATKASKAAAKKRTAAAKERRQIEKAMKREKV